MRRAFAGLLTAGAVAASIGALAPAAGAAGHALELASPLQSEGFNVTGSGWADGRHAVYKLGLLDINARFGARGADGTWSHTTLDQIQSQVNTFVLDGADDLSTQVFREQQMFLVEGSPEGLYVRNPDGSVDAVAEWQLADPFGPPEDARTATYRGRSADGRTLYFGATAGVIATPSASGLYRWDDGDVEPVVLDDGLPQECRGGATVGDATSAAYTTLGQTGVSADGQTIFASTAFCTDGGGESHPRHLFAWRDGDSVDLSEPLDGARDYGAEYRGNSRDGSTVWFVSRTQLTEDDDNDAPDLFAANVDTGDFERLTAETVGPDDAGVEAATVAPGGTAVWFKTTNPLDEEGEAGRGNLFRWTAAGGVEHVLTVPSTNDVNLFPGTISGASEASYDGSTLVMPSYGDLTPDAGGSQPRIYRVTADGGIGCLTCGDPGNGNGNRLTGPPTSNNAAYGVPSVSSDGSTILFESPGQLVPADRNGRVDAYLWRDGDLSLLSTGTQAADSNAAGLSWDGSTAFFTSFGALLPGTTDTYSKLYAARIGQPGPPLRPAPCSGDACQGPSIPPATPPVPLSESFEGAGNVRPAARATFAPKWPGKAALRAAARRGTLPLTVTGSGAGRVSATVQARLGGAWVQVAASGKTMAKGRAQLTLKLSAKARRRLAAGSSLRIRVSVQSSRVAGARSATFLLRGTR